MARDNGNRQRQVRQIIAQQAARMMAEEGISDYAYAKRKAGNQFGSIEASCMPTNAEIEAEIKLYHQLYNSKEQPATLSQLRKGALDVMQMLEQFNPHLTGAVLDGTAGKYADTQIHLFADSLKDVEMFLLNKQVPYETDEKSYRTENDRRHSDRKNSGRKKVPVFVLEGPNGLIKLSVFEVDDIRVPTKKASDGSNAQRATVQALKDLLNTP